MTEKPSVMMAPMNTTALNSSEKPRGLITAGIVAIVLPRLIKLGCQHLLPPVALSRERMGYAPGRLHTTPP